MAPLSEATKPTTRRMSVSLFPYPGSLPYSHLSDFRAKMCNTASRFIRGSDNKFFYCTLLNSFRGVSRRLKALPSSELTLKIFSRQSRVSRNYSFGKAARCPRLAHVHRCLKSIDYVKVRPWNIKDRDRASIRKRSRVRFARSGKREAVERIKNTKIHYVLVRGN